MPRQPYAERYWKRAERTYDAARLLFASGFYPDAVSRAYYAVYFSGVALISLTQKPPTKPSEVDSYIARQLAPEHKVSQQISAGINYLKSLKDHSDSLSEKGITRRDADRAVRSALRIMTRLSRLYQNYINENPGA